MKLLFVSTMVGSTWGGSEELWFETALLALELGYEVDFATYYNGQTEKTKQLIDKGAKYIPLKNPKWRKLLDFPIIRHTGINKRNPFRLIHNNEYSKIIISQGGTFDVVTNSNLKKELIKNCSSEIYVICHSIDDNSIFLSDRERSDAHKIFERFKKVFFVAQKSQEIAERKIAQNIPNAEVIKNPINLIDISYIELPSIKDHLKLAMVGSLTCRWKGQDLVLEALSKMDKVKYKWTLNIYGSGPDEKYLKELSLFYKIQERVHFHGYEKDVRKIWRENHVLIMSSRVESAPLTLVEAMICGRTAVITKIGGMPEWITDNENGFVAESTNVKDIQKTIIRLFEHSLEIENLGKSARSVAVKMMDPNSNQTLLYKIIH